MATKDWHKEGKDTYYNYDSRGLKKVLKIVKIKSNDFPNKNYYVWSQNTGAYRWPYFKTKSQALKYAKAYMRKH